MQQAEWHNFKLNFSQAEEFKALKREVLQTGLYYFETENEKPIIIDGGAHLGLATIYFKWLYPQAHILAFEPNPHLLPFLKANIANNNLSAVEVLPLALTNHQALVSFHFDSSSWQWYSTGSLHQGAWNGKQKTQELKVQATTLKPYLSSYERIDLIKLDLEGEEQAVILSLKEQLDKVQNLIFEFHPTSSQNLSELIAFLQKKGFEIRLKNRKNKSLKSYHRYELVIVEASRKKKRVL